MPRMKTDNISGEGLRDAVKSRKFILALLFFIGATTAMYLGEVQYEQWVSFMKWLMAIYAAGNVGEHVAKEVGGAVRYKAERETEAIKLNQQNLQEKNRVEAQRQKELNQPTPQKPPTKEDISPQPDPTKLRDLKAGNIVELENGRILRVSSADDETIRAAGLAFSRETGQQVDGNLYITEIYT